MATTWGTLEDEIQDLVQNDKVFGDSGSLYSYLIKWGNRDIRKIHHEIDMRYKLELSGGSLTFTNTDYSKALSGLTGYLKISDRFIKVRSGDTEIPIIGLERLSAMDPNHDNTTSSSYPDYCAIEGNDLYVFPMFAGTLKIEGYFTEPTDMTTTSSNPDVLDSDDGIFHDLIIAMSLERCWKRLKDFEQAREYKNEVIHPTYGLMEQYRARVGMTNSLQKVEGMYY